MIREELRKYFDENDNFSKLLFELLHSERPLFVATVLERIRKFNSLNVSVHDQFCFYFDEILKAIQTSFFVRKSDDKDIFLEDQFYSLRIHIRKNIMRAKNMKSQFLSILILHFFSIQLFPMSQKNQKKILSENENYQQATAEYESTHLF